MVVSKFVSSGILLFLDQIVFAGGNWLYWIVISFLSTPSEIGQTTAVFNLIVLVAIVAQLGLEYPILKKSSTNDFRIFGTVLIIVLITTMPAIPILFFVLNNMYEGSFQNFIFIAIILLILVQLSFVSHFVLLGLSAVKSILIIDTISTAIKFSVGYVLTINGYGAFGLLLSFLLQVLFIAVICFILSTRIFGFSIGKLKYVKEIVREAISNMPSKLSWMVLLSLSPALLAMFGISTTEIGIFYMALNISFAVGSFVLSMAQMAVPHSTVSRKDLSLLSLRVGLSFASPLIGALIVSPRTILSLIGTQYLPADGILIVLAVSIFPFSIMINGITKFNYSGELTKLLLIGFIQILSFLAVFLFLTPKYGILGAAFSVLIAYSASSVPVIIWSERALKKYVANFGLAILVGSLVGFLLGSLSYDGPSHIIAIFTSISIILVMNIVLKNTLPTEIKQLLKILPKR